MSLVSESGSFPGTTVFNTQVKLPPTTRKSARADRYREPA